MLSTDRGWIQLGLPHPDRLQMLDKLAALTLEKKTDLGCLDSGHPSPHTPCPLTSITNTRQRIQVHVPSVCASLCDESAMNCLSVAGFSDIKSCSTVLSQSQSLVVEIMAMALLLQNRLCFCGWLCVVAPYEATFSVVEAGLPKRPSRKRTSLATNQTSIESPPLPNLPSNIFCAASRGKSGIDAPPF